MDEEPPFAVPPVPLPATPPLTTALPFPLPGLFDRPDEFKPQEDDADDTEVGNEEDDDDDTEEDDADVDDDEEDDEEDDDDDEFDDCPQPFEPPVDATDEDRPEEVKPFAEF